MENNCIKSDNCQNKKRKLHKGISNEVSGEHGKVSHLPSCSATCAERSELENYNTDENELVENAACKNIGNGYLKTHSLQEPVDIIDCCSCKCHPINNKKRKQFEVKQAEACEMIEKETVISSLKEETLSVPAVNNSCSPSPPPTDISLEHDQLTGTCISLERDQLTGTCISLERDQLTGTCMSLERDQLTGIYALLKENSVKYDKILSSLEELKKSNDRMAESQRDCHRAIKEIHEELLLVKKGVSGSILDTAIEYKSDLPKFPLMSLEDIEKAEEVLANEDEVANLTKLLAEIGGSRLSALVHNIMKFLLAKNIAVMFSLKGRREKKAFENLKLYKCVLAAVRRTVHGKDTSNYEINNTISSNLVGARSRDRSDRSSSRESCMVIENVDPLAEMQH